MSARQRVELRGECRLAQVQRPIANDVHSGWDDVVIRQYEQVLGMCAAREGCAAAEDERSLDDALDAAANRAQPAGTQWVRGTRWATRVFVAGVALTATVVPRRARRRARNESSATTIPMRT